jgi:hypothetical protein
MFEEEIIRILKEEEITLISHLPCDKAGTLCALATGAFPHVPSSVKRTGSVSRQAYTLPGGGLRS